MHVDTSASTCGWFCVLTAGPDPAVRRYVARSVSLPCHFDAAFFCSFACVCTFLSHMCLRVDLDQDEAAGARYGQIRKETPRILRPAGLEPLSLCASRWLAGEHKQLT